MTVTSNSPSVKPERKTPFGFGPAYLFVCCVPTGRQGKHPRGGEKLEQYTRNPQLSATRLYFFAV
jgi:hypothetical protein